jgi:multiple sugar transport system permease protein
MTSSKRNALWPAGAMIVPDSNVLICAYDRTSDLQIAHSGNEMHDQRAHPKLSFFRGIPKDLYEAAEVDGGKAIHKLWYITIPMMTPTILFNLILSTIETSQVFTQPYVMTQGGPNNASLLYVLYFYRKAFQEYEMGYASALAWIFFVIIAAISFFILRTSKRWVYYEGGV